MTPRQAKLVDASEAVDKAKGRLERIIPTLEWSIANAWQRDVDALDLASKTVMAVAADPDAFGDLMSLRAKSVPAFDAIVNLARQELARADAPAEEPRAA